MVGAVLFFVSDASAFITSQVLTVDGGLTATQ
jgi:gluconate 5-dehydrogenase